MAENPTYLEACEERFGDLADSLGFCDLCPRRADFLSFMGEENPVNVPEGYVEEGRIASAGCARAKQIQNGQQPTAEVNPQDCFVVN